jgi:hypothetical protein
MLEAESTPEKDYSFIHLVVCLTTCPKPLPKRALHIVRSRASSFKWEYLVLSLRSSSSFLLLLPRPPVTSVSPFIFPSITPYRRQFLRKMWPRILPMKNSIDAIGNRSRDLPACCAVPQPTSPPRTPVRHSWGLYMCDGCMKLNANCLHNWRGFCMDEHSDMLILATCIVIVSCNDV